MASEGRWVVVEAYEEVVEGVRRQIGAGRWGPGGRLPSGEELGREYGAGPAVVRRALEVLRAEGLTEERHGGEFVRVPRRKASRTNERHRWEKRRARESEEVRGGTGVTEHDTGLTLSDLVFHSRYEETEATEGLAAAFGLPVGTPLIGRVYRTRYAKESAPFSVARSYLVRAYVAGNPALLDETNEPWPGGTHHQLLTVGIELDRVTERVTAARPPTREEARTLGMAPGMAVIQLRKTSIDTTGRVVEVADIVLPGDRTELVFVTHLDGR